MICVAVHLRDGVVALALVDLDEDRRHGGRTLIGHDAEGSRPAAVFERVRLRFVGGGDRARSAVIGGAADRSLKAAVPGQAALRHDRVSGQIDLILGCCPAGFLKYVDARGDPAGVGRLQPERRRHGYRLRIRRLSQRVCLRGRLRRGLGLLRKDPGASEFRFSGGGLGRRLFRRRLFSVFGSGHGCLFRRHLFPVFGGGLGCLLRRGLLPFFRHCGGFRLLRGLSGLRGGLGRFLRVMVMRHLLRRRGERSHLHGHEQYKNDCKDLLHSFPVLSGTVSGTSSREIRAQICAADPGCIYIPILIYSISQSAAGPQPFSGGNSRGVSPAAA